MVAEQIDMNKIIKRLELIKNLIALEESEEIEAHIFKLKQYDLDNELEDIVALLEDKSYSQAMQSLETYINNHRQLSFYVDPKIEGLKLEAKLLEAEVNALSIEKADLEKLIHDFEVRHNQELGELIIKILKHRKEKAKGTKQQEEAEEDYNNYQKQCDTIKEEKQEILTEEEQKELKDKYRKASKLCHPDVVSEEQKELASKLFRELNEAYERNELQRVKEILKNLEDGNFFVNKSDATCKEKLLKAEMEKLRLLIKELKEQIQNIKESEAYTTIINIDNWDEYFYSTKQNLDEQLKGLENAG